MLGCGGSRGRPQCFLLSGDLRAVGSLPQGSQVSDPGNESGRGREKSWGDCSRADRFIMVLLALGVCLSQACGLEKGEKVDLYSGD